MPAVNPQILKQELDQIILAYDNPEKFYLVLDSFFNKYANRVYRAGELIRNPSKTPSFRIESFVLFSLRQALESTAIHQKEITQEIAVHLWDKKEFENKQLSAWLVTLLFLEYPDWVISLLNTWKIEELENEYQQQVLVLFQTIFLENQSTQWFDFIKKWLREDDPKIRQKGLNALVIILSKSELQYLPSTITLLKTVLDNLPQYPALMVQQILEHAYKASNSEIFHFLRQTTLLSPSIQLKTQMNKLIPIMRTEHQKEIKKILSEYS